MREVKVQHFPDVDRPERFNIVGEKRISNLDIAKLIADVMGKKLDYELVDAHSSRPGHDPHYGLCGKKLEKYGYKFPINLQDSIKKMIQWTINNPRWLK